MKNKERYSARKEKILNEDKEVVLLDGKGPTTGSVGKG